MLSYYAVKRPYLLDEGNKKCPANSAVLDTDECKDACKTLDIPLSQPKLFKIGKSCQIGGNGKCKQLGSVGSKARLVCIELGKSVSTFHKDGHHL